MQGQVLMTCRGWVVRAMRRPPPLLSLMPLTTLRAAELNGRPLCLRCRSKVESVVST